MYCLWFSSSSDDYCYSYVDDRPSLATSSTQRANPNPHPNRMRTWIINYISLLHVAPFGVYVVGFVHVQIGAAYIGFNSLIYTHRWKEENAPNQQQLSWLGRSEQNPSIRRSSLLWQMKWTLRACSRICNSTTSLFLHNPSRFRTCPQANLWKLIRL